MATIEPPIKVDPAEDGSNCELLGPTALVVQGLMGVFVIGSLVIKRQLEKRKRRWKIWIWDVGKQLVGQAVVHSLNLLISALVADAANNNPCSLYFLNVLIDTTLGVVIFYFALRGFTWLCSVRLGLEGYVSGQYGNPPQAIFWWRQLVPYLASFVTMKLLVLLPLTLPGISGLLIGFGHNVLEYLSPSVQVVFVMALFPLVMNIIQFCLVDQVIKGGKEEDFGKGGDEEDMLDDYERLPGGDHDLDDTAGRISGIARPSAGLKARFSLSEQSRLDPEDSTPGRPFEDSRYGEPLFEVGDDDPATDDDQHGRRERAGQPGAPARSDTSGFGPFGSTSGVDDTVQKEARRSLSPTNSHNSHTKSEPVGLTNLQSR